MSAAGFRKQLALIGVAAGLPFPIHPHLLRHACGFALANGSTTPAPSTNGSGTRTSSTPPATPSSPPIGSGTSGSARISTGLREALPGQPACRRVVRATEASSSRRPWHRRPRPPSATPDRFPIPGWLTRLMSASPLAAAGAFCCKDLCRHGLDRRAGILRVMAVVYCWL